MWLRGRAISHPAGSVECWNTILILEEARGVNGPVVNEMEGQVRLWRCCNLTTGGGGASYCTLAPLCIVCLPCQTYVG